MYNTWLKSNESQARAQVIAFMLNSEVFNAKLPPVIVTCVTCRS